MNILPGTKDHHAGDIKSPDAGDDRTEKRSHAAERRSYVNVDILKRKYHDEKVVGLAEGIKRSMEPSPPKSLQGSIKARYTHRGDIPLEEAEKYARSKVEKRPIVLFLVGLYTACKIFLYYLISLSSVLTCSLSVGLTIYWFNRFESVS